MVTEMVDPIDLQNRSRILMVCVAPAICDHLQQFLIKDYQLTLTDQFADVGSIVLSLRPDLLIIEAAAHGGAGITACRSIRRQIRKRDQPSVMVFGPEDDELIEQSFAAGVDEYVREPVHWALFAHRVRFLIQKKQAEIEFNRFADQLTSSNRELKDFTYAVSHDLQEPLHLIRAFSAKLMTSFGGELEQKGLTYIQRIDSGVDRMQILIDGLLQYSRVTGKISDYTPINLMDIVGEVADDMEIRIKKLGAILKVGDLGVIEADPLQMRQLFQNLISNALKFASCREVPRVDIFRTPCRIKEELGPVCEFVVRDNGIGFDDNYKEQIFGIFKRLHGREDYNGAGVGLAICKKIVERHGGTITARSILDQGAEFLVVMPRFRGQKARD